MPIIDCIRMYLDCSATIVEGFLGQQNPTMGFRKNNDEIVFFVKGNLTSIPMYKRGQFGVDIYAPMSDIQSFRNELEKFTHSPLAPISPIKSFDPSGKERGKMVPTIEKNWGRIPFTIAECKLKSDTYARAEGGFVYLDLETHAGTNHKTWAENEIMEPFEYHLGIRGRPKEDPFLNVTDKWLLEHDEWFAVVIPNTSFITLVSIIRRAILESNYRQRETENGFVEFSCDVGGHKRFVEKKYTKVW